MRKQHWTKLGTPFSFRVVLFCVCPFLGCVGPAPVRLKSVQDSSNLSWCVEQDTDIIPRVIRILGKEALCMTVMLRVA